MWFRFSSSNSCFLFFIPVIIDISSYTICSLLHSGKQLKTTHFHSPGFLEVKVGMTFKKIKMQNRKLRIFCLLTSASRVHSLDGKSASSYSISEIRTHRHASPSVFLDQMQKHL